MLKIFKKFVKFTLKIFIGLGPVPDLKRILVRTFNKAKAK